MLRETAAIPNKRKDHEERPRTDSQADLGHGIFLVIRKVGYGEPLQRPNLVPGSGYEFRIAGNTGYEVESSQLIVHGRF